MFREWTEGFLLLGLAMVACACGSGRSPSFAVSDSAGAEVLITGTPVWETGNPWTIDPTPSLRVGFAGGDPPYLFEDIRGVVLLDDGRIVVADGLSQEIRFFDPSGKHLLTVGGPGQGPGEFRFLHWLDRCGDGLWAFDLGQRRVNIFSLHGEFQETVPVLEPDLDRVPYRTRCGPDGKMVVAGWGQARSHNPDGSVVLFQQGAPVWLVDPGTENAVKLGDYISSERVVTMHGGSGPHPFGRSVVFTLDREQVFIGTSERLQVEVRNHEGKLVEIFRGPDTPLTITPEFISNYRSAEFRRPDSLIRNRLEEHEMAMPPGMPAYDEFILDPEGNLWVERFLPPWEVGNRWGIFSAEGRFLGHLVMPEGFRMMDVTEDFVIGVREDELEVERIELYRLNRN